MRPKIAIIDPNTLAIIGLKQLLQSVHPIVKVEAFSTFAELQANHPEDFVHLFVSMNIVLSNRQFFIAYQRKTIVLTLSDESNSQLTGFHNICINVPEQELVRSLLILEQHAHRGGRHFPPSFTANDERVLTNREIEIMSLVVRGLINKEIADRLNISLSTVITHRKNVMEKLGLKSVSALTIYAVTHGFVDINSI